MSETLYMRRQLGALRPSDPASAEVLERLPADEDVRVEVFRPRNVKLHRKFFALLQVVYPHQNLYPTFDTFRAAIEVALGYGDSVKVGKGRTIIVPKSISFAKLDQAGFEQLYERAVDLITTRILPAVHRADLEREVADILAGREKAA
jgi:hypothetical protein